ncbi:hypothetical protein DYB38_013759 [Aphanomyces astaci]|uniref:HTH psq-type domain-containing protein n=1 Tax=Aphanomyces astaci TaxID=112090 RepID=A0A397C1B3_APHAT|nr:hypothetical protein DYB38_013759 [Aphanomyces astaci]
MRKGERKKNLTDSECDNLVQHLLTKCASSGRIPKGVAASVGMLFGCSVTTVRRVWRRDAVDLSGTKTICRNVHQRKKDNCGRKRIHLDLP